MERRCFFIGTTLADNPVPHQFVALARELVGRGHRAFIIAPHRRTDLENHEASPPTYVWPSDRPTHIADARFLKSMIRTFKPDCVIGNFVAVNMLMLGGWFWRVPARVAWYHTVTSQIDLDHPNSAWKNSLLRLRKRLVYMAATHLAVNSAASALDLQKTFSVPQQKCHVCHNAIADPVSQLSITPESPEPGRLVCVGRFDLSKGQDVLLRAVSLVRRKMPLVSIEFIGEGPQKPECQRLAIQMGVHEKCTFSGRLPHAEVLKRMATAVATVVPSRSEAFGLVNIESMAVGTPVVASNTGGIPEIVRDNVDGLLVPPGNAEALASALKLILSDPHLRREMRSNARQRFLSAFELSRAIREQAAWLESIVSTI